MPHRLAMVRAVAASLGRASTVDEVADVTLQCAAQYLDAVTSSVWLLSEDGAYLEMRYETNAHPDAMARFARVPLDAKLPGPHVVASGEPAFLESREDRDLSWPLIAGTPTDSEAMVVLPLEVDGRRFGVVSFGFPDARAFDDEDRIALLAVADQCAMGLDRARLRQQEQTRTAAQRLLATISGVDPSMDWEELAQHSVRACTLGDVDMCALYVREGHLVRRVALASQSYPALAEDLVDHFPTPLGSNAANAAAIRTGEETFVPERRSTAGLDVASPAPGYAEAMDGTTTGPGWVFPMKERGVTFGAMLFLARVGQVLDADAVELMRTAAERTANLLISSAAFAEQRAAIEALHEIVLPGDLSGMNGFEIAARYVPLAATGTIGGDWWDALPLPDGRLALAVGDVAGHGIPAAAVMGQLRNGLRMALVSQREPAEALDALSRFLDWIEPAAHCTAFAATADAASGRVTWSNAGHPPPLVVAPAAAPTFVTSAPAVPLGVMGTAIAEYADHDLVLPRGALLVLYTDGLVEGRTRPIDDGMRDLAALVDGWQADESLDAVADRILAALVDRPDDDVCLLVVRRP